MNTHERFLLTELELRIREGERRGRLAAELAELRRHRPPLRQRVAARLVALAYRLSPETVAEPLLTARPCASAPTRL